MSLDPFDVWMRYDLYTRANGTIYGWASTNDDNDDGVADGHTEEWECEFKDRAMMDRIAGRSRIGISGIKVSVVLDGEEIQ